MSEFEKWTASAERHGREVAEFLAPAPNRLVGDHNTTFSQEQLDIPQAEAEHMAQADSMADALGGKSTAVMRVGL
jgi:hypothetical protein